MVLLCPYVRVRVRFPSAVTNFNQLKDFNKTWPLHFCIFYIYTISNIIMEASLISEMGEKV
jgi:hypothetical protein